MNLSGVALSLIRSAETSVFRGQSPSGEPILLVAQNAVRPEPDGTRRLTREYALRAHLRADWSALPLELTSFRNLTALVLSDPGGTCLEDLLETQADLHTRLRIAIALAGAVDRLHGDGVIHGDLRPANVLVDLSSDRAWLIGFGAAVHAMTHGDAAGLGDFDPEGAAIRGPAIPGLTGHGGDAGNARTTADSFDNADAPPPFPGSMPYLAPEQAGGVDRGLDWRSDLYGLGVTLYRLFTGELPFRANTPLEWAHCHITRTPVPAHEAVPSLPAAVGGIIARLLAKSPNERYQSAANVRADLGRCLVRLELDQSLNSSRRFAPVWRGPSRLYGREAELETLLHEFDAVRASGELRFVMIAGHAGVGKSALYGALLQRRSASGLFLSGKFDQYRRDVPYQTIVFALQGLIRQMLSLGDDQRAACRDAIQQAVGPNGQLLVDLIPELAALIGEQAPAGDVPPDAAKFRMYTTFAQAIAAIARLRGPMVLFVDDLQWIDSGTAGLLQFLVARRAVPQTLLIGAYRDNEVDAVHPWSEAMSAIHASEVPVQEIRLQPLQEADVEQLLGDVLPEEASGLHELTALIRARTAGNPFYTIQMVRQLAEDSVVGKQVNAQWDWQPLQIDAANAPEARDGTATGAAMVDFVGYRLRRLGEQAQTVIRPLACLGHEASADKLAMVAQLSGEQIAQRTAEAIAAGLILRDENVYRFVHDSVREAAYRAIEPGARTREHLAIARMLSSRLSNLRTADDLFELVNHFNIAGSLISDPDERIRIALLNLDAGLYAKASTAYASALAYLESGIRFLGEDAWTAQPRVRARLGAAMAESLLVQGRLEEASSHIDEMLAQCSEIEELAQACVLEMTLHSVQSRNADAVASAIAFLARTGIHINAQPTREEVDSAFAAVLAGLGDRPVEALASLPPVEDPVVKARLDVLSSVMVPAYFTDKYLPLRILCEIVNLSIEHGIAGASAEGIALLGSMTGDAFGDYELGYRFARVGCDIAERRNYTVRKAKSLFSFELACYWTQPISVALEAIRAAFAAGVRSGDITMACFSSNHIVTDLLMHGDALDSVWNESCTALDFVRGTSFVDAAKIIVAQQRFIEAMRGNTRDVASFDGVEFDERAFEADFTPTSMSTMVFWYWVIKGKVRCLGGRFDEALSAFEEAAKFEWSSLGHIQLLDFHFFRALAAASIKPSRDPMDLASQRTSEILRDAIARIERWAQSCAATFADKLCMLQAELARLENRPMDAIDAYQRAAVLAREQGAVHFEALAYERAALFFDARGYASMRDDHLRRARDAYVRWGAHGKVRALERDYPDFDPLAAENARLCDHLSEENAQRKRVEATLRESEAFLTHAQRISQTGSWWWDVTANEGRCSDQLMRMFEIEGTWGDRVFQHLLEAIHPDDRARVEYELSSAFRVGASFRTEYRVSLPSGALRHYQSVGEPDNSVEGRCTYIGTVIDLTERKRGENALRAAHAELAHVTRVATLNQLTSSIAHEVSQPLASIVTNGYAALRWLGRETPDMNEVRAALDRVISDGNRATEVIQRIRDLSRRRASTRVSLDMNEMIAETLELVRRETEHNDVVVAFDPAPGLPAVVADRVQLQQVMINLVVNANQALGGVLGHAREIRVSTAPGHEGRVVVAVKDNGPGISPGDAANVFEPFYTTKQDGLGMGLSICRSIIEAHGGRLWLDAAPGSGATFAFALPKGPASAAAQ
ncbi:two-component system, LuxR family, sensor kinase FixL [Pararobbsia alpina]|uniref:trifunctional serine/threonine-protein kinase/ATP-binding protein/sensor histidine kinase n=1 Tax=Pararobbsia alpina TaxID=621374 RepID=UPI0039A65409